MSERAGLAKQGRMWLAYKALAESNLDAVFDFHQNGGLQCTPKTAGSSPRSSTTLGYRAADIAQQEFVIRAESVEDIRRAHQDGKVAIVPAIESRMPIENELDRLDVLYGIGVRLMGSPTSSPMHSDRARVTCIHTTEGSPRSANRRSNE